MSRSYKGLIALALSMLAASGGPVRASASDAVDLFPPQPWASLLNGSVARHEEPAPDVAPAPEGDGAALLEALTDPADAAAVAAPFEAVGEWVEGEQRIIVLENQGQAYLVCQRCDVAGVVRPGQTLAHHYQFRALEASRAVLQDPQGRVIHIDLTSLAP